jgi:threonine/homoserine/homoserine lactone efflux protein
MTVMLDLTNISLFIAASLVLLLTPGPSVLYIVTRTVMQGRAAGMASVFGVQVGALVHVLGAALGLSAVIASSALLFSLVKYLGAAYLIYLGVRTLCSTAKASTVALTQAPVKALFIQGFWVAALNPKTALFFLAFLPQFVVVDQGNVTLQLVLLGLLYVAMSCVVDTAYAMLSSGLRPLLMSRPTILQREKYVSGPIYIGLGLLTAFGGRGSKD